MGRHGTKEDTAVKTRDETLTPRRYRVILFNDDYTSMDFVVHVLETVFKHTPAAAVAIMMKVHVEGQGIAGVYPHEVAETKVLTVHEMARAEGFPLRAGLEAE